VPQPRWQHSSACASASCADALERVVRAAAGQLDEVRDEISLHRLRLTNCRDSEALARASRAGLRIDADDLTAPTHPQPLHYVEADTAER